MSTFKESLKNAICNEDIPFLEKNRHRYNINDRLDDEGGDTLLLYSLSDPNSITYKFFLKNEADQAVLNEEGENIIHSIVYSGKVNRLNGLLNNNNINHRSNDGATPLLLSIALEKFDISSYLIEHGADIEIADNTGNMPIHIACHLGNIDLVADLVKQGANLRSKTAKGNLPLALAVNAGHNEVVKFLFREMYQ